MLRRVDVKELSFGLFLIALALVAFGATSRLSVGSASDMGPGFVPRGLALVILGFGAFYTISSLWKAPQPFPILAWRPLLAILAAIALFAVLFAKLGLVAACMGAVLVAGSASPPWRPLQLIAFGATVAGFCSLLFVKALGLPLQVWPSVGLPFGPW